MGVLVARTSLKNVLYFFQDLQFQQSLNLGLLVLAFVRDHVDILGYLSNNVAPIILLESKMNSFARTNLHYLT